MNRLMGSGESNSPLSDQRLRVLKACRLQKSDKIPKGEFGIEPALCRRLLELVGHDAGKIMGNKFSIREEKDLFAKGLSGPGETKMANLIPVLEVLSMDLTAINPGFPPRQKRGKDKRGRRYWIDFWGNEVVEVGNSLATVVPACSEIRQLLRYNWPVLGKIIAEPIERWSQETPYFIFSQIPGPFSLLGGLSSFLDFLGYTQAYPEEIKQLATVTGKWLEALIERCIKAGAQGIVINEDLAYDRGPWIAESAFRKIFFPALGEMVRFTQKRGVPILLHSDGNIRSLLPDVVDMGFDGIHSLQPSAGMRLVEVKAEYGTRLCLMGNLDCDYLLPQGSIEEIKTATLETLRVGAPEGGFIFSSCAGILSAEWPAENVLAMYRAAENF